MVLDLVDLLEGSQYYPVYDILCRMLESVSIIRLSKTCRRLATLYRDAIPREWSVDRLLLRFVKEPRALRSEMQKHKAVISGSLALQFFERVTWEGTDLDLFVHGQTGVSALARHLVDREGYRLQEEEAIGTSYRFSTVGRSCWPSKPLTVAGPYLCEGLPEDPGCAYRPA